MAKNDPSIPPALHPKAADYSFDLEQALRAVVALRATVPEDAFTASTLGTERAGSAVHIRDGLFLTIGYLITEAESVWLSANDGQTVPGHAMAFDQETGFGLVQALGRIVLPTLELGDSQGARVGDPVVFAAAGGRRHAVAAKVAGRQEFAGYWEYLLDDAIFTTPAHPFWGGAALIGADGKLLGIGSLVLQQGTEGGKQQDMNMVVPVQLLLPILDDLLAIGRVQRAAAALAGPVRDGGRRGAGRRRPRRQRPGGQGRRARRRPHPGRQRHGGAGPGRPVARGLGVRPGRRVRAGQPRAGQPRRLRHHRRRRTGAASSRRHRCIDPGPAARSAAASPALPACCCWPCWRSAACCGGRCRPAHLVASVPGLSAPVRIGIDADGIPRIQAASARTAPRRWASCTRATACSRWS